MSERRPFLRARWAHLTLFTFAAPRELLAPRLPPGVELDTWEGRALASVVGLDFHETRVLGVGWPGYRDFADVNFRFYARAGERRGVVFIGEIVPHRLISWLARVVYDEPFRSAAVTSRVQESNSSVASESSVLVERHFDLDGSKNTLRVTGKRPAFTPTTDSLEHFLKERAWGFGKDRAGVTQAFEVEHPVWECLPVESFDFELDAKTVYGPEWAAPLGEKPVSVALAVGSEVSVFPRARL